MQTQMVGKAVATSSMQPSSCVNGVDSEPASGVLKTSLIEARRVTFFASCRYSENPERRRDRCRLRRSGKEGGR